MNFIQSAGFLLMLLFSLFSTETIKLCPKLNDNLLCQCEELHNGYVIKCPGTALNPRISVRITGLLYVEIKCNHFDVDEYKELPAIDIKYYDHLIMHRCPLPAGNIPQLLDLLGIQLIKALEFEVDEFRTNLTREHLNGLGSLESLSLNLKRLTDIPCDLLGDFPKLNYLNLKSLKVKLPPNIFVGLEHLKTLKLFHYNLKQLPADIFRNQRKLQKLYLHCNQLRELPPKLFTNNNNLRKVHLTKNRERLETLPSALFANLPDLQEVNIDCNIIPDDPYDLKTSDLHWLVKGCLVRIRCGMTEIPDNLFANSSKIIRMSLAKNEFVTLPENLLAKQYDLDTLDLSHNKLQSLPDKLFRHTRNLIELKLSFNQLTKITRKTFTYLANLKTLYLDNNYLMTIENYAFTRNLNLLYIYMQNNRINLGNIMDYDYKYDYITNDIFYYDDDKPISPFENLFKLKILNLQNNSVQYIYRDWKNKMPNLKELDLSCNNITSLDYSDLEKRSQNAIFINLTHNQIRLINFTDMGLLGKNLTRTYYDTISLNNNPLVCDCKLLSFVQYLNGEFRQIPHIKWNFITDDLVCDKPDDLKGMHVSNVQPKDLLCPIDSKDIEQPHCTHGCSCWKRTYDLALIVNCSNTGMTKVPALPHVQSLALESIELHVENNNLLKLPKVSTPGYKDVKQIYAAGNNLSHVEVDNLPANLTYLDLSRNNFERLSTSLLNFFHQNHIHSKFGLADNPWNCDCENMPLMQFVQKKFPMITDAEKIYCAVPQNHTMIEYLTNNDICQKREGSFVALKTIIILTGFLIALIAVLYYKYQTEIKVWMYKYRILLCLINVKELDKNKKYDAFISYSHKDEQFIAKYLVPELEEGPIRFKLCVHVRDFIVGECIPDQILQAVNDSSRTIMVLSQNFIESAWARMEFRSAHQAALNERRSRLIVILYSDIADPDSLDSQLKAYLKMNTYLKWGDPKFWDNLRYAMPHPSNKPNTMVQNSVKWICRCRTESE